MPIEAADSAQPRSSRLVIQKLYSLDSQPVAKHTLNRLSQQKVSGSTMMHPRTRTGRSLVGLVLVLWSVSTYGCGDTGTQNQPAELGNLAVSDGTLDPQFTPATTSYTVQLSTDVSSTTITATPRIAGDTIRIDNQQTSSQTITLNSPGAEQSVNIVVTDTGTGGTSKSYTVLVKRASLAGDNFLENLAVSPGTLAPPFNKNSRGYTVTVENNIGSITITPTLSDPLATMTVNGQAASSGQSRAVNLNGGNQVTTIPITIAAQDGSSQSYEIAVSRGPSNNNNLQGLTVSAGNLAPSFRADRTSYTVNVGSSVERITIRPTLSDTTATMTVNGQTTTSGQSQTIELGIAGSRTVIPIIIIAQNGALKTYSVNVVRAALNGNNNLSALTVSSGSLDSAFSADDLSYTVNVGSGIGSVRVTPTLADSTATMTVNGQATTSGQPSGPITLNPAGQTTTIPIVVTAQNQTTKTYSIIVIRAAQNGNNNLSALTISPGTLDSPFTANDLSYTVNVGSGIGSVRVTPTLADSTATMTVNGQAATSGQPSGPITLNPAGQPTSIQIVVTAQNQTAIKNYSVTVVRDALGANSNLTALTISPGSLDSPFTANDLSYTVNVGSGIGSVRVTPTLADSTATMTVNGQAATSGQPSGPITLNPAGQSTSIQIVVTAQNQTATNTYSVTVVRAALGANSALSELVVTPGALDSPFDANDQSYTVNVDSTVENVTVSAKKADRNATMALGSATVSPGTESGQATFPLNGAGGEPTPISVTVTAQNGVDIKVYTISVIRPAAPTPPNKPAAAPDLITADDSCPLRTDLTGPLTGTNADCATDTQGIPFGTRDDNFTSVTIPRFRIPQPGVGETPNLYVDGIKVDSTLEQTAISPSETVPTLKPTAALTGSNNGIQHLITSTVTNTTTNLESGQSDALIVTISTGQSGT